MVAIFTGLGSGFERGSAAQLGGAGMLGSSVLGRAGQQLFLNAATGNLVVQQQDEFLVGRGPDIAIGRTYNSLGNLTDENGDNWRQNTDRRLFGLTGTANQAGSTIKRRSADGSEITYSYNVAAAAYLTTDGAGAHDKLVYDGVNSWKWTDGSSQVVETYGPSSTAGQWWITEQKDPSGNALTFTYTGGRLTRVATADGGYTDYSWDTANNRITQIVTGYLDLAQTGTPARTLTRTRYAYDAQNRLSTVTVDLTPGDNSIAAGKVFSTYYAYHGSSTRIASIAQSDGTRVDIDYVLKGSDYLVSEISQWVDDVSVRTTRIDYDQVNGITTVTAPDGIATRLFHDAQGKLTKVVEASPQRGAEERVRTYSYDAGGNVVEVRVHDGLDQVGTGSALSWVKYSYDANGNVIQELRNDGLNIRRTYSAANELLTETSYVGYGGDELSDAAPSGGMTSRFVYDNKLLRYSISAAGHVTAYEYCYGELVRTISFPAHAYDVSALGPTSVPTYGTMQSWVTEITRTDSIRFNRAGEMISTETSGKDIARAGASYQYDDAGRLTSVTDVLGNKTRYLYDHRGRQTAVIFDAINNVVHQCAVDETVGNSGMETRQVELFPNRILLPHKHGFNERAKPVLLGLITPFHPDHVEAVEVVEEQRASAVRESDQVFIFNAVAFPFEAGEFITVIRCFTDVVVERSGDTSAIPKRPSPLHCPRILLDHADRSTFPAMADIDLFSLAPLRIELLFGETVLARATAFIWDREDLDLYLVTNWHNVSGRNAETRAHLSPTAAEPDRMSIAWLDANDLTARRRQVVELKDGDGLPLWNIHPNQADSDLVSLKVSPPEGAVGIPMNRIPRDDIAFAIGEDVFVLGFPLEAHPAGLPVWKRGSIATEPAVVSSANPTILVDTASRPGMSGSPVVHRKWDSWTERNGTVRGGQGRAATTFVGIYSGRLVGPSSSDVQLGRVWPATLVDEVVKRGVPDRS